MFTLTQRPWADEIQKYFLDTEKLFSNKDLCAASKESGVQNIAASKKGGEGSGVLCALSTTLKEELVCKCALIATSKGRRCWCATRCA